MRAFIAIWRGLKRLCGPVPPQEMDEEDLWWWSIK
jgi:hypothetical protein